jgi:hypothetical protein
MIHHRSGVRHFSAAHIGGNSSPRKTADESAGKKAVMNHRTP